MLFKRTIMSFASIALLFTLVGCGEQAPESDSKKIPVGTVKIKFSDKTFPEFVSVTGVRDAEAWGRRSFGEKVVLKFGSHLPGKFTLIISARTIGDSQPLQVKVGDQTKEMKLDSKKVIPQRLEFSLAAPADTIEIEIPKLPATKKGGRQRVGIAFASMELVAAQ